ncbi:MAG: preprotein translocase subunit SecG [Chloroflexi bacterium]|nr:preprotein translocase subunit SecG [Chloroflexota bacterium]
MERFLNIAQILVAILLIIVVSFQVKGMDMGGIFGGGSSSVYRTRRGVEKTLFQATIVLAVLFIVLSMLSIKFR